MVNFRPHSEIIIMVLHSKLFHTPFCLPNDPKTPEKSDLSNQGSLASASPYALLSSFPIEGLEPQHTQAPNLIHTFDFYHNTLARAFLIL